MSFEIIMQVAQDTRRWAVRNRIRLSKGSEWGEFDKNLCGMCAIAAAELFRRLQSEGIECKIAMRNKEDDGHCFVMTNEYIVDVTATQFGYISIKDNNTLVSKRSRFTRQRRTKPVEIVPIGPKKDRPTFWQETSTFENTKELVARQRKTGWPLDQMAWA